jgi:predicted RNase H-like HicB family nuclease
LNVEKQKAESGKADRDTEIQARRLLACYTEHTMVKQVKVIVERHQDGYVAYPIGLKGVVVGEGETYEDALADVKSAIRFHIETFGSESLETEQPVLEAFIDEAKIAV